MLGAKGCKAHRVFGWMHSDNMHKLIKMSEHIERLDASAGALKMCIIVHELWTIR